MKIFNSFVPLLSKHSFPELDGLTVKEEKRYIVPVNSQSSLLGYDIVRSIENSVSYTSCVVY